MKLLKDRIINDGNALSENVLKVDSFLNHQIDPVLMKAVGEAFIERFKDTEITKVLTLESSGIAPSVMVGLKLDIPVVFGRKRQSLTLNDDLYTSQVFSYTKQETNTIAVARQFLSPEDKVLIIDDFLANGEAANALMDVVNQSGAEIVGFGIVIEKAFQSGGKILRDKGYRVESLAKIESMYEGNIKFVGDTE
ncbi:xanthine phosphoribosyltransferase [Phocicoccus pinnipedialis]|uniref:Xanthine phosphoribosyltransferase n=1 Tax=Phocicoccus pinnipedialis TaxID=110845 RepID=A0A6V7R8J0_9BACL|nr:xanthine phosphoribosyltransferase [Jeotgalicoccus pinnipedialis]MBP1940162.1 xanthine phosphoribosyltransferase [Jeotgalicoccus pinnipedialis]CAD2073800.1 Xanthine phosphoribosyltransferase [Jeotgalicoccus pinnipedialis]